MSLEASATQITWRAWRCCAYPRLRPPRGSVTWRTACGGPARGWLRSRWMPPPRPVAGAAFSPWAASTAKIGLIASRCMTRTRAGLTCTLSPPPGPTLLPPSSRTCTPGGHPAALPLRENGGKQVLPGPIRLLSPSHPANHLSGLLWSPLQLYLLMQSSPDLLFHRLLVEDTHARTHHTNAHRHRQSHWHTTPVQAFPRGRLNRLPPYLQGKPHTLSFPFP